MIYGDERNLAPAAHAVATSHLAEAALTHASPSDELDASGRSHSHP
jgi:hypothetical protein